MCFFVQYDYLKYLFKIKNFWLITEVLKQFFSFGLSIDYMAKSSIPGVIKILPILYFEVFKYELNLDLQICKKTVEM